jgi:DNA-binding HxlR family transcriptional regulator
VAKQGSAAKRKGDRSTEQPAAPRGLHSVDGAVVAKGADEGALALDRLIHERMRLGIVSALAVNDSLTFNDLKRLMQTTDGNLSVHARKLEDAAYVSCTKSFEGRVPRTVYRLTAAGRRALERYLDHMEALIRATRER